MLRVTEIHNPAVKQTFTPRLATEVAQPNMVELTTQDQVQTQVLKNHLQTKKDYLQPLTRYSEESKDNLPEL